jgi:hypothetical protein
LRDAAMDVLKVLLDYLKVELGDPDRMDPEIIEAIQVLFKKRENFFSNHSVKKEITEKDQKMEEDIKKPEEPTPSVFIGDLSELPSKEQKEYGSDSNSNKADGGWENGSNKAEHGEYGKLL